MFFALFAKKIQRELNMYKNVGGYDVILHSTCKDVAAHTKKETC